MLFIQESLCTCKSPTDLWILVLVGHEAYDKAETADNGLPDISLLVILEHLLQHGQHQRTAQLRL